MSINYVAIRLSGQTITGQTETFYDAALELRKMLRDPFYNRPDSPIKTIFLSDETTLSEYLPSEIENPANWQEGR
ncbi:MAG: hypothetical protein HZB34_07790 [Nitrospirae bacterium]|nr:hypothetical protein [Nitrospirota bacterium]